MRPFHENNPMTHNMFPLYVPYAGPSLLEMPLLNKGSAFTQQERIAFNLEGLLPHNIETLDEQVERAYQQYLKAAEPMGRHIFLRNLQDTSEILFYKLLQQYLKEMMPMIYTPVVGQACQEFSNIYRRHRGLFISYPERERIDDILNNATHGDVKVIVVTDGERILGLGDQGIGGMGIPIGKLSLYTACGGINPAHTLPIVLDCGTNNEAHLKDPRYMGWRHQRITGEPYDEFIELFIQAVKRRWPDVLLQFEDFAQHNAQPLLDRYHDKLCCFNDDIQGTACVTVGSLLAACRASKRELKEMNVVFLGAGSAGCGIAEQIIAQMRSEGLSDAEARARIFMVDRYGLLLDNMPNLTSAQSKLVQPKALVDEWGEPGDNISLQRVIEHAQPEVLLGVSGQPGLFNEALIKTLYTHCQQPIIFPLSNPTSRSEALPQDLIQWTNGQALVATGSPFDPVQYGDRLIHITQCNNSYVFPGIGLGILVSGAKRVTREMFMAASRALAECSPLARDGEGSLLPPLDEIQEVSKSIARLVAKTAQLQGHAVTIPDKDLDQGIDEMFWLPHYRPYRRTYF